MRRAEGIVAACGDAGRAHGFRCAQDGAHVSGILDSDQND